MPSLHIGSKGIRIRRNIVAINGVSLLLLLGGARLSIGQNCSQTDSYSTPVRNDGRPDVVKLRIIAFGTSLMWGNGLRQNETFRHVLTDWVAEETARPVELTTFAHSGALLTRASQQGAIPENPALSIGDLNASLPTVDEQIDCAAATAGLDKADLILIEGCINDVGAEDIVYPWTDPQQLKSRTTTWCGHMVDELRKVGADFPRAHVVVVGYYPLVSYESPVFGWGGTRRLAKHASKVHAGKHPEDRLQAKRKRPRKNERATIADNSEIFYQKSKKSLMESVASMDAGGSARFFYAGLPEIREQNGTVTVDPRFAFGAPDKHQWLIPIRILFFWALFKDHTYWHRQPLCQRYESNPIDDLVCDSNTAFHPNPAGAALYTAAIKGAIPAPVIQAWRNDPGTPQMQ
jgi:hypothetical protein